MPYIGRCASAISGEAVLSPLVVWSIAIGVMLAMAFYVTRLVKHSDEDSLHDMGLAILEFGRAYPAEAIRSLHSTADANTIFVRLHDNKSGIMRNRGNHFACHVIRPGRVRVTPTPEPKGFSAEFLDSPTQNGTFVFKNENEAAEVSLWLLDNYVSVADRQLPAEPQPASDTDRSD